MSEVLSHSRQTRRKTQQARQQASEQLFSKKTSVLIALISFTIQGVKAQLECSAGQFAQNGVACVPCTAGYECAGGYVQFPSACQEGYYSQFGASSCTICPESYKCPSNQKGFPVKCDKDLYSEEGWTECQSCPAGSVCVNGYRQEIPSGFIIDGSTQSYIACPAGYYCPDYQTTTQCDSGFYSIFDDVNGITTCTECPLGHYCPSKDMEPIICPDGFYTTSLGQTECTGCPAGSWCANGIISECQVGTWALGYQSSCHLCPDGHYCDDPVEAPTPCDAGFYQVEGINDHCFICPGGQDCSDRVNLGSSCASGMYLPMGQEKCAYCPAGYECPFNYHNPVYCEFGYYSLGKQESCTICPAGQYCSQPNYYPRNCQIGTYQPDEGKTSCIPCPLGKICNPGSNDIIDTATDCADTEMTDEWHQKCFTCPAGFECGQRLLSLMTECKDGWYSLDDEIGCTPCPAGSMCPDKGSDPVECDDGYYALESQTSCKLCPLGYSCDKTGLYQIACRQGEYTRSSDMTCQPCDAGQMCPEVVAGLDLYHACPDGTYTKAGQAACQMCDPGMYCSDTATEPIELETDNYITMGGATSATKSDWLCPVGFSCNTKASYSRCPAYFYSDEGDHLCHICPDGKECMYPWYDDADGDGNPDSYYDCPDGYFMSPLDYHCQICPKGFYCEAGVDVTHPTACQAGTYQNEIGMTSCKICPAEYYSGPSVNGGPEGGAEVCTPIPKGWQATVSVLSGQDATIYGATDLTLNVDIAQCLHTTYSDWGEETCSTCPDGFICPPTTGALGWQYSCPKGSYCQAGVQTKCPGGYYGTMERGIAEATACEPCPAGYYCAEGTDNYHVYPCEPGYYCPRQSDVMTACPSGSYNNKLYATNLADCQQCPLGHYCDEATSDMGTICPGGYYCPLGSAQDDSTLQFPCPAGTYSGYKYGLSNLAECIPCPAGHYCPEATDKPTEVDAGYYQPHLGTDSLDSAYLCPPGFYCPNTAMVDYKGYHCEPGYYCPAGSTDKLANACPEGTYSDRYDIHDIRDCAVCPRGRKCGQAITSSGMSDCAFHEYCPLGTGTSDTYYCPSGFKNTITLNAMSLEDCIQCAAGTYCVAGAGEEPCDQGFYCPAQTNSSTEYPCPAGTYGSTTGLIAEQQCTPCGIGNYCPGEAETLPTACPAGYYNNFDSYADECEICPAGYECSGTDVGGTSTGTQDPVACSAGFYSAEGQSACTECEVGYFCPYQAITEVQKNLFQCYAGAFCSMTSTVDSSYNVGLDVYPDLSSHACSTGYYCPRGTSEEKACPVGTYNPTLGRKSISECTFIQSGYYVDTAGSSAATGPCDIGFYCPKGSISGTEMACPNGTYYPKTGGQQQSDCGPCKSGYYCNAQDSTITGTSYPVICPMGAYCPEGSVWPTLCPLGTYNDQTGLYTSKQCTGCPAGLYCMNRGMETYDSTQECDAGYWCMEGSARPEPEDDVRGQICPAGQYCEVGTVTPANCPSGQFNSYQGKESEADACEDCWPGYYCEGDGLSLPTSLCEPGYYCPKGTGTLTSSEECPMGTYSDEGQSICTPCPRGTYTSSTGQSVCTECIAGELCDSFGMQAQDTCLAGHYCPSYAYFFDREIFYEAYRCPAGTIYSGTDAVSDESCEPCPGGQYCRDEGQSAAIGDCYEGFFCEQYAESDIPYELQKYGYYGPCPAGKVCTTGTTTPADGTAQYSCGMTKQTDTSNFQECPVGHYCEEAGISEPTGYCSPGWYCGVQESSSTPAGQYCDSADDSTQGNYCPQQSSYQIVCPIGRYSTANYDETCTPCTSGNYCWFGSQFTCPEGYYCQ